jgi:uncharacterized protein (TIGR03086 family)
MTDDPLLKHAHAQFARTLSQVSADDWSRATPCEDWPVLELVNHVVAGERLTTAILSGASTDEGKAVYAASAVTADNAVATYDVVAQEVEDAFAESGALERVVHHPMGDMPASQVLGFRLMDNTLHAWDLARGIGADDTLDPRLVEAVWGQLAPVAEMLPAIGVFGAGPSGTVRDDADPQQRLLDLTGRRP